LRGFEASGIGPRDLSTDDALGGNISLKGTVELSFPLGLPEEYQIRGRIFTDFGTVFRSDFKAASVVDDKKTACICRLWVYLALAFRTLSSRFWFSACESKI